VEFFCDWSEDEIYAVQDYGLIFEAVEYKDELSKEHRALKLLMGKYPDIFTEKSRSMNRKEFVKFYNMVCSRCFGWGLPHTSQVPMADNFNHADCNTVQEVVHKRLHMEADEKSSYYQKTKFMNNYTFMFEEELKALENDDSKASKELRMNV